MTRHVPRVRSDRERAEYERIGRERLAASREADRAMRRELLRCCLEMIASVAAGLALVGLGMRVDDLQTGRILLYAGVFVIVGGVTLSIALSHHRAERRGDI